MSKRKPKFLPGGIPPPPPPPPGFEGSELILSDELRLGGGGDSQLRRFIVMEQYRRCLNEGSKEMTTGGVAKRVVDGEVVEIIVPNQIEIFMNSVDMLKAYLTPDILDKHHVKFMLPLVKKYKANLKRLDDRYRARKAALNKKFSNRAKVVNITDGIDDKEAKRLLYNRTLARLHSWYVNQRLYIYRTQILVVLARLLHKVNYFEEGSI